jgi:hypothetical protein
MQSLYLATNTNFNIVNPFQDVTAYRTADLSSICSVKYNAQSFDFNKPRPDKITVPDALLKAKQVDIQSKYFVLASVHEDQE